MEIVAPTPSTPFHNRDVREWSRIDNLTGALERARLETDHWSASTSNTAHKYNRVVDSRARSNADGAVQQHARRQLEVFQSSVPGGRLQVIKSHTVSSSRWSGKSTTVRENKDIAKHFEDLQLTLNPLDLSSQKSKASVGRSIGKRPPSRPHVRDDVQPSIAAYNNSPLRNTSTTTNIHRVSRLCHQIHDNAIKHTLVTHAHEPSIYERQSRDGVEIIESEKPKPALSRTRSSSSEDINLLTVNNKPNKSIEDLEDLEQLQTWRRASKVRRSLQFPKQTRHPTLTKTLDLPKNTGSVRRIREDLETGRRLSTALRGNNVDLEALDQILQSISNSSGSDKNSITDEKYEEPEKDTWAGKRKQKRDSFVTVESLKEVKDKLRRTSSPCNDLNKKSPQNDEDIDDGIVTEENSMFDLRMPERNSPKQSRVRSYVYGMETMMNKKSVLGTGSLESRPSKQYGSIAAIRNEDWYNRRKSYGFEQVHNQHESINSITKVKTVMDSSTDSGICRSSEIVVVPITKQNINYYKAEIDNENLDNNNFSYDKSSDSFAHGVGNVKRYTSIFENKNDDTSKQNINDLNKLYEQNRKIIKPPGNHNIEETSNSIPVKVQNNGSNTSTNSVTEENNTVKRHSIAVDETKYIKQITGSKVSHVTLVTNDSSIQDGFDDESMNPNRKSKKVEFCKTEVHFAAESGRVNIVETDGKPPPTNNFRRRRRHSATLPLLYGPEKVELPLLHFGENNDEKNQYELLTRRVSDFNDLSPQMDVINSTVTVSTGKHQNYYFDDPDDEVKEYIDSDARKGILKNKPIKPKPYLLGDNNVFSDKDSPKSSIWGVQLKSVPSKKDVPIWKSTVTLKNTLYNKENENNEDKPEVDALQMELQKILQNLQQTTNQNISEEGHRTSEKQNIIRIIHPPLESQQTSLLIPNTPSQADDLQQLEGKGYSTKVNIGHGEATVVKNSNKANQFVETKPNKQINKDQVTSSKNESSIVNSSNTSFIKEQKRLIPNHIGTRSPVILRKNYDFKKHELKTAFNVEKLSSPSLVGQERCLYSEHNSPPSKRNVPLSPSLPSKNNTRAAILPQELSYSSDTHRQRLLTDKGSPFPNRKESSPKLLESNLKQETHLKSPNTTVLRTPRKSEMTYFGIKVAPSPKSSQKLPKQELSISNKPDLLLITPRRKSPVNTSPPIYENISNIKPQKQFDSSILDELTKAADQILQAVNEYAEEANFKESSMEKPNANAKLETISETKSWRHRSNRTSNHLHSKDYSQTKRTSSTSSIDSTTDPHKNLVTTKTSIPEDEARKKKNGSETSSSSRAAIKARRLQRANSREALLQQSHGSSSEDLPITVPVRKPRICKKSKPMSSTLNETDSGKTSTSEVKRYEDKTKIGDRISMGALPEIRHKTAVSTIRSTAEKSAMRDRIHKSKQEDLKKTSTKKESTRTSSASKTEKSRSASNREPINHRISTANIKKFQKSEIVSK